MSDGPVLLEDFPLAAGVARRLLDQGRTLAVAESCTGGLLGAALTSVPGSAGYFLGGVIAYSNALKQQLLSVDPAVLDTQGAVSEATAREMAEGVRRLCGADIGVAVTGIAGPGSAGSAKPVGLIHIAVVDGEAVEAARLEGDHGRERNRSRAVEEALSLIERLLA